MDAQRRIEQRILAEHKLIADRLGPAMLEHARRNLHRWADRYERHERPDWMHQWEKLLDGEEDRLREVLTSTSDEATRLRSSSPFAGVIPARERWALYRQWKKRA